MRKTNLNNKEIACIKLEFKQLRATQAHHPSEKPRSLRALRQIFAKGEHNNSLQLQHVVREN